MDIQAEISRLQAALSQHKQAAANNSTSPYPSTYTRGRGRGRGSFRGAALSGSTTFHRNASWVATPSTSTVATSTPTPPTWGNTKPYKPETYRNRSLVLNKPSPTSTLPTASGSGLPAPVGSTSTATTSLVTKLPVKEVVIDGVTFISDSRGNKLVRKPGSTPTSLPSATTTENSSTPKRTSISGTTYIRTKGGNLVSLEFAKKKRHELENKKQLSKKARLDGMVGIGTGERGNGRARGRGRGRGRGGRGGAAFTRPAPKRSTKLCRFFQRTGQCTNGLTCPYVHSSLQVSICLPSLRGQCPRTSSTCPLSHLRTPERTPHCLHFPNCSLGPSCPYIHVSVSPDAGLCEDFAELGWCDKGRDCEKKHKVECWEFAENGVCKRKGCRLPHVLRRRNVGTEEDDEVGGSDEESGERRSFGGRKREREDCEEIGRISSGGKRSKVDDGAGLEEQSDFVGLDGDWEEEDDDEDEVEEEANEDVEEDSDDVESDHDLSENNDDEIASQLREEDRD